MVWADPGWCRRHLPGRGVRGVASPHYGKRSKVTLLRLPHLLEVLVVRVRTFRRSPAGASRQCMHRWGLGASFGGMAFLIMPPFDDISPS